MIKNGAAGLLLLLAAQALAAGPGESLGESPGTSPGAIPESGPAAWFPCRSCHGDTGLGSPAIHAPAIAGQQADYIARQLRHYRDGVRGGHADDRYGAQMALMAANLSDEAITTVAAYAASLPAPTPDNQPIDKPRSFQTCIACHGSQGEGNSALAAPRIAGLDALYSESQLRHFRDGVRGANPGDAQGTQMAAASKALNDGDLTALAQYLQSLAPASPQQN